jgi:hypothetical protein
LETLELAPDPLDVAVTDVLTPVQPPVSVELQAEPPPPSSSPAPEYTARRAISLDEVPLSELTRDQLIERLKTLQNIAPSYSPPVVRQPTIMTERQASQRDLEMQRGAERNVACAAQQIPRRPPLTSLAPGRQEPQAVAPLPLRTEATQPAEQEGRGPDDGNYVPSMAHGYVEPAQAKQFNDNHRK